MGIVRPFAFIKNPPTGIVLDPDAYAFLSVTGLLGDPTIVSAVNTLAVDIKAYGLWGYFDAIYPFVGGTATTHKYNLRDPQDTDAAFRIVWNGTITHSATGVTPAGASTSFGDTKWVPSTYATINDWGFGTYLRTNNTTNGNDFGAYGVTGGVDDALYAYFSGNHLINMGSGFNGTASTGTQGFFCGNRGLHNYAYTEMYKNGTRIVNASRLGLLSTRSMTLFGSNRGGTVADPSNRQSAFAYLASTGLTTTGMANLYTIVQAFQTTLGRQV